MNARLRPYAPDDFAAVGDFWADSWAAVFPEIDFRARLPWLRDRLDRFLAAGVDVLVAIDSGGLPVGLVTLDRATGELDQLCVARAALGSGVALALLAKAKALAPEGLSLSVNRDNGRAVRFYRREGFREVGAGSSPAGLATLRLAWRPVGDPVQG